MRRLAIVALVLAACSNSTGDVATSAGTAITPAPTTTTTTTPPVAPVTVRLGETEARAAAGAAVQVGQTVRLTGTDPGVLLLPFDRPVTLAITYVVDGVATDPTWTQTTQAAEDGSTELVIEQPWRRQPAPAEPIVLAWQAAGDSEQYLEQLSRAPGLTVTSPRWWTLDSDGLLIGETDPDFVSSAHELGLQVWPYVTNGFEPARTRRALADGRNRSLLAAQLSGQAQLSGADGVNVDFEAFSWVDRNNFTAFVAKLTEFVHSWGGLVSVDITARTDDTFPASLINTSRYDRRALAEASDYLALMAYDEYNRYRPSGPTASQQWTEDSLHWLLRYADPHQILLGVPYYSRIWDPADLGTPTTARIGTVVELAESNPRTFDPEFGIDRVDLEDGRYLWAEDYDNLAARIEFARQSGVAGTAAWRLGFDTPEVWEVVDAIRD
jgi:spore germination protein YaaH